MRGRRDALGALAALAFVGGCAAPTEQPPAARPEPSPPAPKPPAGVEKGRISLYGEAFAGKPTASGAPFDPQALTMAHRTLPFGTRVRVTNVENGRSVVVVVNDRGPFVAGRIADLSLAAARAIGMVTDGVVEGMLEVIAAAR